MYRSFLLLPLLFLLLSGCGAAPASGAGQPEAPPSPAAEEAHQHQPTDEPQLIADSPTGGYCGNTLTQVRPFNAAPDGDAQTAFWGSDSIALTDLLLTLDYSGEVCRCLPEYTVDTEFGTDYGVSLTGCYVRHDGAQADLTAEQVEAIRDILDRNGVQ